MKLTDGIIDKRVWQRFLQDKTDLLMLFAMLIVSALDLFSNIDLTGALPFFFVYAFFAIVRIAYWKVKYGDLVDDR